MCIGWLDQVFKYWIPQRFMLVRDGSKSSFVMDVKVMQSLDQFFVEFKQKMLKKLVEAFSQEEYGVIIYQGRLSILNVDELREQILTKAHSSQDSINPGATNMYRDLWKSIGGIG